MNIYGFLFYLKIKRAIKHYIIQKRTFFLVVTNPEKEICPAKAFA
jgi:hypothetical protein